MGVQINGDTGNISATKADYSGNVTIGGVLTYEDVTNVDSIGIVTARAGVLVGSGITLSKDGDIFATGVSTSTKIHVGVDTGVYGEDLVVTGNTRVTGITTFGTSDNPAMMVNIGMSTLSSAPVLTVPDMIKHSGDPETRIRFDTGVVKVETTKIERLRVDSSGRLLLGTTTEGQENADDLTVAGSSNSGITIRSGTSSFGQLFFSDGTSGDDEYRGIVGYSHADNFMKFHTNAVERLRIDSSGKILIGDDTAENTMGLNARVQTFGTDASTSGVAIRRGSNDAQAAFLVMSKSRNTSVGSRTILQNGDEVGNIFFVADDGTDLISNTAAIKSQINGTPGANDTPGNLSFWTTSDGANSATQRMIIDSVGRVTKPYQFHIVVARSGNQSSYNPSQGFGTGVVYNTVVTTQGTDSSALDTSNGRITVPIAGIYFLEGSAYSDSAVFTQGWFTKNGSRLLYSDFMDNSGNSQNVNSVGFHKLAANDTIGFKAYGSGSTSTTVVASGNHTWLRITLVG